MTGRDTKSGVRLRSRQWSQFHRRILCLLPLVVGLLNPLPLLAGSSAPAQGSGGWLAEQPAKVRELLGLLADPQIQEWLKAQQAQKAGTPAPSAGSAARDMLSTRLGAIRAHMAALAAILPQLPDQLASVGAKLDQERQGRSPLIVPLLLAVFLGLGFVTGILFLRATRNLRQRSLELPMDRVGQRLVAFLARLIYGALVVAAFAAGSIGAFLIFDWPPLLREILWQYLMAFLGFCLAAIVSRFLLAPGGWGYENADKFRVLPMARASAVYWHRRLLLFVGWFAFGYATLHLLDELGFDPEARRLVAYVLGLGLVAIGLEIAWRNPSARVGGEAPVLRRRTIGWVLSIYFVLLWVLWVASATPLMWLLIVLVAVPWVMGGTQRAVAHILRPPGSAETNAIPSLLTVALERGLRDLLIIGGALLLADKWHVDLVALTSSDTVGTRLVRGLLSTVVIVLVADFGWQLLRTAIDRKIAEAPHSHDLNSEEARRHARLRTLLPIFRNVAFIVLLVMVALMGLAALGVDIGPLVAGASVVGVAVGFGAQTLVKDIISGMFYLLDDAFRVGEYIQSGNFKGTVESFSLRSVKLRHHRGPLYTVPFGTLGAIQNMSRDWVIDKLSVGITYDSDLNKVKKIIKQIGKELMEDPELGPKILEPLKMQGVEQFGDFAIQIRMKMMTKPGEQFVIRRRAYALIKQAFDAQGVTFAFPTVQVAGGETPPPSIVASAAQQAFAKPAAAEA